MGTLKVNGNIEASTMLKLNGDWETDFGILFQEGGGSSYGAFIKYGLNDYLTIGTRNNNNDITAIKIYRGDNSITINGSVTASSFIGNLNGNATSASSVPWSGITSKPSTFTPSAHSHNTLTFGSEGGTASVRTADYTSTVLTGGWASTSAGYLTQYGTTLDISGYSTWYHRLAFNTNGTIEYWQGINTKTMSKIGNLITSANIGSQSVNYANSAGSATYTSYIKDSYNSSNITITYGKSGQSSTSWLASWNGYELGAIAPANITAGWASGASSSNALASTGWGNGNFTYLQTSGDFYGNSGWSHYLISNHGDGSSYYNFVIALPFWSYPKYKRMSGGSEGSWYNFYTTENVIIQSSTPGAGFYG